jgi:hypothetical protein
MNGGAGAAPHNSRGHSVQGDGIAPRALFRDHAEYWINMQARYDLEVARDKFGAANKQIKPRTILGESYAHR